MNKRLDTNQGHGTHTESAHTNRESSCINSFRQHVGQLSFGVDVLDANDLSFNELTDVVVAQLNVFGTFVGQRVVSQVDSTFVVTLQ